MKKKRSLRKENSQMIVLMGIVLAISVFAVSSLAVDISNLDIVLLTEQSTSLLTEFTSIKETFAFSLNYNLVDDIQYQLDGLIFQGDINNLSKAFDKTKDEYYSLELQHDILFDAKLNGYRVAHPGSTDGLYHIDVTLYLENRNTCYTEDVTYAIKCMPPS